MEVTKDSKERNSVARLRVGGVIRPVGNQLHARDPNAEAAIVQIANANDLYVFALVLSGFILVIELVGILTRNLQNIFACA
jgi:hypothetical protein